MVLAQRFLFVRTRGVVAYSNGDTRAWVEEATSDIAFWVLRPRSNSVDFFHKMTTAAARLLRFFFWLGSSATRSGRPPGGSFLPEFWIFLPFIGYLGESRQYVSILLAIGTIWAKECGTGRRDLRISSGPRGEKKGGIQDYLRQQISDL